jgi:hypothetical protein
MERHMMIYHHSSCDFLEFASSGWDARVERIFEKWCQIQVLRFFVVRESDVHSG